MVLILHGNSEISAPRSSDPFYIVAYYIKLVTTSWADGKAFNLIESSHKSKSFLRTDLFSFMRAEHVLSY